MATIYQLKKYLKECPKGEYTPYFLDYLQCFHTTHLQDFDPSLIEDFYLYLMKDLENRFKGGYIRDKIIDEIQPFLKKHLMGQAVSHVQARLPFQIVVISQRESLLRALEQFYKNQVTEGESVRVVPFGVQSGLILYMKQDGCLVAKLHSNSFVIKDGQLHPLTPLCSLFYDSQLELEHMRDHFVTLSDELLARFQLHGRGVERTMFYHKDLSKVRSDFVKNISDDPALFAQVKKIESYFIAPQSDPHYKKLIQSLQSCYQLLLSYEAIDLSQVSHVLDEARRAIKDFYCKDRLLLLLMANIEYRFKQRQDVLSSHKRSPSNTEPSYPSS